MLAIIASEYELGVPESSEKLMTKYHDAIDAALNFIDTHFDGKLYLEDVCRIALMSHSTFSYIFKQVTGQTFSEYVMKLRLSCACKLLDTTDMTITEICQNSGFGDSTYFTRMFKKRFGIPPSRYRADSGKKSDGSENN
ncbi:MAG: AraC family transcriptional regulator [Clostridia bacterium]